MKCGDAVMKKEVLAKANDMKAINELSLKGEMNHYVTLGTDARGNLTRIDNVLGGIEGRIETTKQKLAKVILSIFD